MTSPAYPLSISLSTECTTFVSPVDVRTWQQYSTPGTRIWPQYSVPGTGSAHFTPYRSLPGPVQRLLSLGARYRAIGTPFGTRLAAFLESSLAQARIIPLTNSGYAKILYASLYPERRITEAFDRTLEHIYCTEKGAIGLYNHELRSIFVNMDLTLYDLAVTLVHELTHAWQHRVLGEFSWENLFAREFQAFCAQQVFMRGTDMPRKQDLHTVDWENLEDYGRERLAVFVSGRYQIPAPKECPAFYEDEIFSGNS